MSKVLVFIKNKLGFLLAVTLAAVVGGTTTAAVLAAIPNSQTGEINACYRTQGGLLVQQGALRVIDEETGGNCAGNETPLNWEQSTSSGTYQRLTLNVGAGAPDTQSFVFPDDTPVMAMVSSEAADIVCSDGATLTGAPQNSVFYMTKDSATGIPGLSRTGIQLAAIPNHNNCQVVGRVSIDTSNNTITVSHDPDYSGAQLTSPVTLNWTLFY